MVFRFLGYVTAALALAGLWGPQASAQGDRTHEVHPCQISKTALSTPEGIWSWATRGEPLETDFYGNEIDAVVMIWLHHGKEALEPYLKTRGYEGLVEGVRGAWSDVYDGDGLQTGVQFSRTGTGLSEKELKKSVRAFLKGRTGSDDFPSRPNEAMRRFAFSRAGACYDHFRQYDHDRNQISRFSMSVGPFPAALCQAAFDRGVPQSGAREDIIAVRRWRGDYAARPAPDNGSCPILPALFEADPSLAGGMAEAKADRAADLYDISREKSAAYCFPGVVPEPSLRLLSFAHVLEPDGIPGVSNMDDAVAKLDPGDRRVTPASVRSAYELWKFYRNGTDSVQDIQNFRRCFDPSDALYCGVSKDAAMKRLIRSRQARHDDKLKAVSNALPARMSEDTGEFLRQNLGDCALETRNMTPLSMARVEDPSPRPAEECAVIAAYIRSSIASGDFASLHPNDRRWHERWTDRSRNGAAPCKDDFDSQLLSEARSWRSSENGAAVLASVAEQERARAAAPGAPLYSKAPSAEIGPATATPFGNSERDRRNWTRYNNALRCSNPTANC